MPTSAIGNCESDLGPGKDGFWVFWSPYLNLQNDPVKERIALSVPLTV